jgi:hypothetical protein
LRKKVDTTFASSHVRSNPKSHFVMRRTLHAIAPTQEKRISELHPPKREENKSQKGLWGKSFNSKQLIFLRKLQNDVFIFVDLSRQFIFENRSNKLNAFIVH